MKTVKNVCTLIPGVTVLIIRYAEIGLKSPSVRTMFENRLKDNILSMLMRDGVEALVYKGEARFYAEASDTGRAVRSLRKVFGIASVSIAEQCMSDMADMCSLAERYAFSRLPDGSSFAVRARREGTHTYTSMDAGREVGSAIYESNKDRGITVDLTSPDVIFFLEIRNNRAYIFSEYVRCHGGLPLGTQGRVGADVFDDRGLLSAWLMMRRGCKVLVRGDYGGGILGEYDPNLKEYTESQSKDVLGLVSGSDLGSFSSMDFTGDVPLYFPTIGMSDENVQETLCALRAELYG